MASAVSRLVAGVGDHELDSRADRFVLRDAAVIALLAEGCTAAEVSAMQARDVRLRHGDQRLEVVVACEGARETTVWLSERASATVLAYLEWERAWGECRPAFATSRGRRLSASGVRAIALRHARASR